MSRAKATSVLEGVLERAVEYDADTSKPYRITQIRVFGSYMDPDAADLGDLDLAVTFEPRDPGSTSSEALLAYARATGRSFSTFVDELFYAEHEVSRVLRNRSGYINVHTEDITRFTDRFAVVYPPDQATCAP